jgi:hypothetical protein
MSFAVDGKRAILCKALTKICRGGQSVANQLRMCTTTNNRRLVPHLRCQDLQIHDGCLRDERFGIINEYILHLNYILTPKLLTTDPS